MAPQSTLDRIDFDILAALQNDARISNKDLAAEIGIAPSTCLERTRQLRAEGALLGEHADVNPTALGIGLEALVSVRIRRHSRRLIERFQAHVLDLPEATAVYHLAGENDFLVHVVVRDVTHLRDLVLDAFTTRPEVAHVETALIFGHRESHVLPNYVVAED